MKYLCTIRHKFLISFFCTILIAVPVVTHGAPGDVDLSFDTGPITWQGFVSGNYATAVQPDGKILVGGRFDNVNGTQRFFIARFESNGALDPSFVPPLVPLTVSGGPDGEVYDIALQPDGKMLVGGYFAINGQHRSLVRLNVDGTLDPTFNVTTNGGDPNFNHIYRIVLQPDGKVVIGSNSLESVNGVTTGAVARLNSDGTLNASLGVNGNVSLAVFALALQPDGKILVGGGSGSPPIIRLNPDGTRDIAFEKVFFDIPGIVDAIVVQPDGFIVAGGRSRFFYFGAEREAIFRLFPDGAMDGSFLTVQSPVIDTEDVAAAWSILLQNDGKIVIGGNFVAATGHSIGAFGRLNSNGSLDFTTASGGPDGYAFDIARQSDGKFIVVGNFENIYQDTEVFARPGVARLFDGNYLLSGSPTGPANIVADDALDVYLNGVLIYTDGNAPSGSRSPISITAEVGDTLRFVVRDTFGNCASLSPIYLIDNLGRGSLATEGFQTECGRPVPNPTTVYDETFVIPPAGPNTPTGTNVAVQGQNVNLIFENVTVAGTTTFTPIDPTTIPDPVPAGYSVVPAATAYEITTTATFTGNITVCLTVSTVNDPNVFDTLRLMHGEGGVLIDVTTSRDFATRKVCGVVTSLSPFVIAQQAVNNAPVLSDVTVNSPINENGTVTLSGNISDANIGDTFDLTVNWGDGSTETFHYLAGTTSFSETHTYVDNGAYTLSLTLIDNNGGSDTDSTSAAVNNVAPVLSNLNVNPAVITAGGSTTLTGNISDAGTLDSFTVFISWGDTSEPTQLSRPAGSTAFESTHQYNTEGNFTITVTLRDDDAGEASSSIGITVNAIPPPVPSAPSDLIATAGSVSSVINIAWTHTSGDADGFRIERCNKGKNCTNFIQIAEMTANDRSFQNTGLSKNTEYRYRVRAFNAAGNSGYSNIASARTLRK